MKSGRNRNLHYIQLSQVGVTTPSAFKTDALVIKNNIFFLQKIKEETKAKTDNT